MLQRKVEGALRSQTGFLGEWIGAREYPARRPPTHQVKE